MNEITVFNLGNLPTAEVEQFNELQEDFKIYDPDKNMKLQMLIVTRGFKYAFKAWQDPDGKLWIIDAHQRKSALLTLRKNGFIVPAIPYEPIHAKDKREAVEEIAAYNSEFAKKNSDTQLFAHYDIGMDTLQRFNLSFGDETLGFEKEHASITTDYTEIEEDEAPELDEKNIFSREGDIWLLGKHRLMCGSSTVWNDVKRLMAGKQADLVVTDPPYNVNYEGKTKDALKIKNDHMTGGQFYQFLFDFYSNMYRVMRDGASYYIFHADTEGHNFRQALFDVQLKLAQCLIWVKQAFIMGRQDYHWQHEPILYGWKPTGSHTWYADRKQSTVIEYDRPIRNDIHPTMKPVGLIGYLVQNSSKAGHIVADFFSGSGATIMACEQTDRICFAMELDPVYVDQDVRRFSNYQNSEDIRLIRDGKEILWNEIKEHLWTSQPS